MRFGHPQGEVFLGRDFGQRRPTTPTRSRRSIDAEVRRLIDARPRGARSRSSPTTARSSTCSPQELIEHETLEAERVQELFADVRMWDASAPATAERARSVRPEGAPPRAEPQHRRRGHPVRHQPAAPEGPRDRPQPQPYRARATPVADRHRADRARGARDPRGDRRGPRPRRPRRARRRASRDMYEEIFAGLHEDPSHHLKVTFEADHDEMVMVRDIPVHSASASTTSSRSSGKAHVAYIPGADGRITGLSKLARLVDGFAKRPQVQERLTTQIADALSSDARPGGRAGDDRGRAPLHVDAGREEAGIAHDHVGGAGPVQEQRRHPGRGDEPHHLPREPPVSRETVDRTGRSRPATRPRYPASQCSPGRRSAGNAPP